MLPTDERKRRVYFISNNTLVESPIFQGFVDKLLDHVSESVGALQIPVEVVRTNPIPEETFWVNLLGKGYPAPNRNFRWCTDRMKIRPTTRFIREQVSKNGEAILLLGLRRAESTHRAQNIAEREQRDGFTRLSPHNDVPGCYIYTPIKDLLDEEVWLAILSSRPPWGGSYRDLVTLYKNANGGECPFVTSTDDSPSCGSSSARFGCWTCTVVQKDTALDSLIAAGHEHLEPLSDFRKRLRQVSENPEYRSKFRRTGQPGLGPLTIEARKMLLDELLKTQAEVETELVSPLELRLIREQWAQDETQAVLRELAKTASLEECN